MDNNEMYNGADGQTPAQGYNDPAQQGYAAPAQGYNDPAQQGYAAPAQGYNDPAQQGYAAPAQGYGDPAQQNYQAPTQNYYAQPSYTPPVTLKPQEPGEKQAAIAMIMAVLGLVMAGAGVIGLILSVVGILMAASSKKLGYNGGLRTTAFVLSVVGCVFSGIWTVGCLACGSSITRIFDALSSMASSPYYW